MNTGTGDSGTDFHTCTGRFGNFGTISIHVPDIYDFGKFGTTSIRVPQIPVWTNVPVLVLVSAQHRYRYRTLQ